MALESQQKQIGTNTYEVTQLNAIKGRAVFTRFAKMVAPIVGEISSDAAGKDVNERLTKAFASLLGNVSEEDMNFFCDAFAPTTCLVIDEGGRTRRPNLKELFGLHFAANYAEMLGWLYFCIEVNFGSFFAAAGLRPSTAVPAESK